MAKRHKADARPTIAQIAQAAEVSVATVSKVLNGRVDVSPPTRERVERVIKEFGFIRHRPAHTPRKGKTGLVDLVIPRLDDDFFFPILEGVEQVLKEAGMRLVLSTTDYAVEQQLQWLETAKERPSDGILFVLPSDEVIEALSRHRLPFVIIHKQGGTPPTVPSVSITSWDGGFAATNHLLALGHRRIAYIGKNVYAMDGIERFAGYRTALEVANVPLDPALQREGEFSATDGYLATRELMALNDPPTAIFAGNDHQATGVYRALYELGITIPTGVSVIGFDNLPFTELMNPPLTTVQVPRLELGRIATTMLLSLISQEPLHMRRVILPTRLIERQSCLSLTGK